MLATLSRPVRWLCRRRSDDATRTRTDVSATPAHLFVIQHGIVPDRILSPNLRWGEQSAGSAQSIIQIGDSSQELDTATSGEGSVDSTHRSWFTGCPSSSDSTIGGDGRECSTDVRTNVTAEVTVCSPPIQRGCAVHRECDGRDQDDDSSEANKIMLAVGCPALPVSEGGVFSIYDHTEEVSPSGATVKFDLLRDAFGFVEVKVLQDESALMQDVKIVNRVYAEGIIVRGERATYIIDPVVEGPSGLKLSGASIRYFFGRYDGLAETFGRRGEGVADKERDKVEFGSTVVQACLPVATPDGHDDASDISWEADGEFTAVWDGDELWLNTPLTHFCWRSKAWRTKPRKTPPISPVPEMLQMMESGKIEAAKNVHSERLVSLQNATDHTVWTCTIPDSTPANKVAKKKNTAAGLTAGGIGVKGDRTKSLETDVEATGGATSIPWHAAHNCLSPFTKDNFSLGGIGDASVVWYTVDEFTPLDLKPGISEQPQTPDGNTFEQAPAQQSGRPLACGFDLARLEEEHGYVVDEASGNFVKKRHSILNHKGHDTYPRLKLVRNRYNGRICPGSYSRMRQAKLEEKGLKDFVLRLNGQDVCQLVNQYSTHNLTYVS